MTQERFRPPPAPASRLLHRGVAALLLLIAPSALAQSGTPREHWTAEWISHPTAPPREQGVFHFRRILHLEAKPAHFPVEVSADTKQQLLSQANEWGQISWSNGGAADQHVGQMLQLIVATREYQFA